MNSPQQAPAGGVSALARLYWLFLGNVVPVFVLTSMALRRPPLPSVRDAVYWASVAALVVVRYLDIRHCRGETGDGRPATLTDWRTYAITVTGVALVAWALVRLVLPALR